MLSIAQLQGDSTKNQVTNLAFPVSLPPGPVAPVGVEGLGNNTKLPTTYTTGNGSTEKKAQRYNLLHIAGDVLPGGRVAECSKYHIPTAEGIDLVHNPNDMTGHIHHVMVCGSKWVCPVCAGKKGAEDRELLGAFLAEVEERGHTAAMFTFTLSHNVGDRLRDLIDDFNRSFSRMKSGRQWSLFAARYGLAGDVVGNEVKYGFVNGWHYHKHVVFIFEKALNQDDLDEMQAWVSKRYRAMLAKFGRYADEKHGVVMTVGDVDDYMTKWGLDLELTASESKQGESFTPFGLLGLAGDGDLQAKVLYVEYSEAIRGVNRIRFSRGLKARYGFDDRDLKKEAQEAKEQGLASGDLLPDVVLETLEQFEYSRVVKARALGGLILATATGKRSAVWEFLEQVGVPVRGSAAWLEGWLLRYRYMIWLVKPDKQRELVQRFVGFRELAASVGLSALWEDVHAESMGIV